MNCGVGFAACACLAPKRAATPFAPPALAFLPPAAAAACPPVAAIGWKSE